MHDTRRRALKDRRKRALRLFVPTVQGLERRQLLADAYAYDGSFAVLENRSHSGIVSFGNQENDGSTVAGLVSSQRHGALTFAPDGSFTYVASSAYAGPDSFTFDANDSSGTSRIATVTINVQGSPQAGNASYSTPYGVTLVASLPVDSSFPANLPCAFQLVSNAAHGAVALSGDGSFSYAPGLNYQGSDSFTYDMTDGASTRPFPFSLCLFVRTL